MNFIQEDLPVNIVVNVDTYHSALTCRMEEPKEDVDHTWLTENIVLRHDRDGTGEFKYKHEVILDGEPVATLLSHPRNTKKIKHDRMKLEILNNLLWSSEWIEVKETIKQGLNVMEETPTRVDIAIDGANHIHKFLNYYTKMAGTSRQTVYMKGKAMFMPGIMDKQTGLFKNFKIGNSDKKIRIYNKTSEIDGVSHKEYIRRSWERAGLDVSEDVFRCELRMNATACKQIKDLDILQLQNPQYLLQIFSTQIKNFFEFVKMKNEKEYSRGGWIRAKSRAKVIDLFEFCKLKIFALEKVPRMVVAGAYKAKMAIHNVYNLVLNNRIHGDGVMNAVNHMIDLVKEYDLVRWWERKKDDWIEKYGLTMGKPKPQYAAIGAPQKLLRSHGVEYITQKEVIDEIVRYRRMLFP